jgi:hypothetical protein
VITNEQGLIGDLSVEAGLASSDHGLVKWSIYVGSERRDDTKESMDYKRADFEGWRRELTSVDWMSLMNGDIEEDWIRFRDLMRDLERKYVPVKKGGGSRKAVWMTFRARRAVINKRKVFARHKDSEHPSCREANKRAAREIRSAKLNFEKKLAESVKFDAKSFYAYVRSKSKSRSEVGGGPGGGDLFDMIVSREKVRDLLRKLRADKAPGVDELSPRLLLHFPEEILDPSVCCLRNR